MSRADERSAQTLEQLFNVSVGRNFKRLDSGNTPDNSQKFYAIRAMNGSATVGSNTEVDGEGDAPDGDVIQQGAVLFGDFTKIDITNGTVYAYFR